MGSWKNCRAVALSSVVALCFLAVASLGLATGCAIIENRPVKQMAYAEAALQGAILANAETNPETQAVYQLAKDSLSRARSFYRLKNFREARQLAVRARRLAEEAEWKALRGNTGSKEEETLVK